MEKHLKYGAIISEAIAHMFTEESQFPLDMGELQNENNLTEFFHALANLVPTSFYNKITGKRENTLTFNRIANQLAIQYSDYGTKAKKLDDIHRRAQKYIDTEEGISTQLEDFGREVAKEFGFIS